MITNCCVPNRLLGFILFSLLVFFLNACKVGIETDELELVDQPLELTSFSPGMGAIRDVITLQGNNFGTDSTKIKVFFNQSRAHIISYNINQLLVEVPTLPGDSCVISIVTDYDTFSYTSKFGYTYSAQVSTLTGNGQTTFLPGHLAQAQVYARYLCIDNYDNLYASVRDGGNYVVAKINEQADTVSSLIWNTTASVLNPNGGMVHPQTGVLYIPHDNDKFSYYTFDPQNSYSPKEHPMVFPNNEIGSYTGTYKYGMTYCSYDRNIYTRLNSGEIVRIDPMTNRSKVVFNAGANAGYGLAFHPLKPYLLYLSVHSGAGLLNGIYTLDIRDPYAVNNFKRISSVLTDAGYQDGPVEQAKFNSPRQLDFDKEGNLFIADYGNHCIRVITNNQQVITIAGQAGAAGIVDGLDVVARFKNPWGIAVGKNGNIYVADHGNARIRKISIQ